MSPAHTFVSYHLEYSSLLTNSGSKNSKMPNGKRIFCQTKQIFADIQPYDKKI